MQNVFAFGRITVQFSGPASRIGFLRNEWNKFLASGANPEESIDTHLELQETPSLSAVPAGEGWHSGIIGGKQAAVYTHNDNTLFALQCKPSDNSLTVFINSGERRQVLLGAQFGFLTAMYKRCVGLHGVTLLCGNEIVILSAPSGTGKTTLAHLLETYCDAIVLNGDFALLSPTEDSVIFEPTPFCGTSGRCLDRRVRVDRIVFLGQSKANEWREPDGREALTRFMNNAFVPTWDEGLQQAVQENIMKCVSMLKVNAYDFAPEQKAAEVLLKKMAEDSSGCRDTENKE